MIGRWLLLRFGEGRLARHVLRNPVFGFMGCLHGLLRRRLAGSLEQLGQQAGTGRDASDAWLHQVAHQQGALKVEEGCTLVYFVMFFSGQTCVACHLARHIAPSWSVRFRTFL